jgi:hypothetical protein
MPNRYSLRLRDKYAPGEQTGAELINEGIGDAINSYLKIKGANNEFSDEISKAGGTIDPQPTWRDRLNQVRHPFGGGQQPMSADQVQQGMVDRQVRPIQSPNSIVPQQPGVVLPRGVTPITDAGTTRTGGGQFVLGGARSPQRGIAGAIGTLTDSNPNNQPNQMPETYTQHGPTGQVAHIPFVNPREVAAGEAAQRAKRAEFEYETTYKTDEDIRKAREAPSSGLTFEQRQQLAKEDDDRYLSTRMRLEGAQHGNTLSEIDRRGRYSNQGGGGDEGGIDSKETSRGNALVSAGQRLMTEATDNLTGDIKDKVSYDRGRRLMDQGTHMLGEQPEQKSYARAPQIQTREGAMAAAAEIRDEAVQRFPNASKQAISNYVRNVMTKAGWKVTK